MISSTHRPLSFVACSCSVFLTALAVLFPDHALGRDADKRVRTIYHKDGGKTLSEQNNHTGLLEEYMYDNRNVLVLQKRFQIDRQGRARQGQIFDAKSNLVARVEYGFDEFGRMEEERMFDARNNVIRRLLYRYTLDGKRLRPVAYTYQPGKQTPQKANPDTIAPTIMTPEINGVGERPGVRYEEGGMRPAPTVSTKPILRNGSSGIRR
jgi:hypothetical protein